MLVEKHKLEAVLKLPSGVFRPYAGVSTAILFFTKTGVGGTDHVWFYDLQADGLSLDDKRTELLPLEKQGPTPRETLAEGEHEKNNLPDALARWFARDGTERDNPRTAQSFCVPKAEITATGTYDLSLNRYKQVEHEEVKHESPSAIIADLRKLEDEISEGLTKLEAMLG
jgi:type I restriction enzyme M protein